MAMKIRQMIAKAGSMRRQAASYVDVKAVKVKKNKQGYPMVVCKTLSRVSAKGKDKPKGSANTYVTTLEIFPKGHVVSCSCDDFKFTWETALNKKSAARIEYSNGIDATEKNPTHIPGCCKHIIALGKLLIEKGQL